MAIIDNYTTQDMRNLIFKFYPGTYTPQKFGDVTLNWAVRPSYSSVGNIQASINALEDISGPFHDYTYTYLKECVTYVVGYSVYGVQILKGRCTYGGIRDLGAYIAEWFRPTTSTSADICGFIYGTYSGDSDLSAFIGMHSPADLLAYIDVISQSYGDLPSSIHGFVEKDLPGFIRVMSYQGLNAVINPVPPSNLPAYLKVWPMKTLLADIYGWQVSDLSARMTMFQYKDLPVYVDMHPWVDLPVYPLRAWAREVEANLSSYATGVAYDDLSAIVRATYLNDLPAYVFPVRPKDLGANIYGWQILDLPTYLNGVYGAYDLQATINAVRYLKNLSAYIRAVVATQVPRDLSAIVRGWEAGDIRAIIHPIPSANLSAYLNAIGVVGDLPASIYPKTIRLTSVVSVATMEHHDLSAVINPSCMWSEPRDLAAYIRCVYKSDLGAILLGKRYDTGISNLEASVGFTNSYTFIDKLPLLANITVNSYLYEDRFPISFSIFTSVASLGAYITGIPAHSDLSAYVHATAIDDYHFDIVKNKEKVYNLNYMGIVQGFETVELSFKSIVEDYFYSTSGDSAWKRDRIDRWILDLKSYVPANTAIGIKRKLHKIKSLYDTSRFESVDEAIRLAIDYVTSYPYEDFPASIVASGRYVDFPALIRAKYFMSTQDDLQASITAIKMDSIVVGTTDGLDIL